MKCWMIKNTTNDRVVPFVAGWTRKECIERFVLGCNWYKNPTWKQLRKDGFKPAKVIVEEA